MKYTLYKPTGEIVYPIDCPDITEQILAADILWIEGYYPPTNYYIDNGAPVEFPPHSFKYANFDYTTKTWVENVVYLENEVKAKRNALLSASDWTQLPNGPLSAERQAEWATYRQQLRDITDQTGYPTDVIWPTTP